LIDLHFLHNLWFCFSFWKISLQDFFCMNSLNCRHILFHESAVWCFSWLNAVVYFAALSGSFVCDLDYAACEEGMLGRKENAGFLYFRPSYQCLQGFTIPQTPFLVGILILQSEVVWARILPLRLLLRLGSEYRCKCLAVWQVLVFNSGHDINWTVHEALHRP